MNVEINTQEITSIDTPATNNVQETLVLNECFLSLVGGGEFISPL